VLLLEALDVSKFCKQKIPKINVCFLAAHSSSWWFSRDKTSLVVYILLLSTLAGSGMVDSLNTSTTPQLKVHHRKPNSQSLAPSRATSMHLDLHPEMQVLNHDQLQP
jgi:hypothetical protein